MTLDIARPLRAVLRRARTAVQMVVASNEPRKTRPHTPAKCQGSEASSTRNDSAPALARNPATSPARAVRS